MLNGVNRWVEAAYPEADPYDGALDGRITRDGNDTSGSIIPITILHHNDSHGNLVKAYLSRLHSISNPDQAGTNL